MQCCQEPNCFILACLLFCHHTQASQDFLTALCLWRLCCQHRSLPAFVAQASLPLANATPLQPIALNCQRLANISMRLCVTHPIILALIEGHRGMHGLLHLFTCHCCHLQAGIYEGFCRYDGASMGYEARVSTGIYAFWESLLKLFAFVGKMSLA